MPKPLLYEDLLGNLPALEQEIACIVQTNPTTWDPVSINLIESDKPDIIAIININVTVNRKEFNRELVIFKIQPLAKKSETGFTVQWGSVPHPIIPIIHAWLKKIDTSLERTRQRTLKIKEELLISALSQEHGL